MSKEKQNMAKHKDVSAIVPPVSAPTFQRIANCVNSYANNVRYEQTVHDVTIVFGQSDMSTGTEVVKQNIAVTVPWAVAKLALYYLSINLHFYELYNGKIPIPANQVPPPFSEPSEEVLKADPNAMKAFELANKLREQFISDQV
jgi:hypothetical protein